MVKYTIKRLLQSIVTVLIVVTIVFLLMRMLPIENFFTEDQLIKYTEEQKHDALEKAGMLDSMPEQLVRYYGQLLHGDLGESRRIQSGQPVTTVIGQRFTVSMRVGVISLCISLVIGVTMGIIQARHKDKVPDHIGTAYTIFVNAVPPLVSYSLILIFGAYTALSLCTNMFYRTYYPKLYFWPDQLRMNSLAEETYEKYGDSLFGKDIYILENSYGMSDFYKDTFFKTFDKDKKAEGTEVFFADSVADIPEEAIQEGNIIVVQEVPEENAYRDVTEEVLSGSWQD